MGQQPGDKIAVLGLVVNRRPILGIVPPTLQLDDIVIIDNASIHKVIGVAEAIEAVGAKLLYLPQYSPDFNPIEQAFSKLKALLRKAAERTVPNLQRGIAKLLPCFTATARDRSSVRRVGSGPWLSPYWC
jgi:hypothetical protein